MFFTMICFELVWDGVKVVVMTRDNSLLIHCPSNISAKTSDWYSSRTNVFKFVALVSVSQEPRLHLFSSSGTEVVLLPRDNFYLFVFSPECPTTCTCACCTG